MTQRKVIAAIAVVSAGALTLSACGSSSKTATKQDQGATSSVQQFSLGTAQDSTGPAVPVTGATKGGTAYDIEPSGFDYLDPTQQYVSNMLAISGLYNRTLTGYKIDAKGNTILVGDLATDTGKLSDGGKTWTWTLKKGLKFQDGTPITSADVKYDIERLYLPAQTQGPNYFPLWLSGADYRKVYAGPTGGKSLPDTVIGTPDAQTVVFHFTEAHADAPYAAAMPPIGAFEASKESATYNNNPNADGPYQVSNYVPGKSLQFVRNPNWDPSTDPIRAAYPDKWSFELGVDNPQLTTRLEQATGNDKFALSLSTAADASQSDTILNGSQYKSRMVSNYQPYVEYLNINTTRVTDVRIRKAIALAFPNQSLQKLYGGPSQLDPGNTLISPTVAGWENADPFNKTAHPNGDPTAAKALLTQANAVNYKLVFAFANTPRWQKISVVVQNALQQAGFQVVLNPIDKTSYYTQVGTVKNTFDIYRTGWGADWPTPYTDVPNLLGGGSNITDGSPNYSHYNNPATDAAIAQIKLETDVAKAAKEWNDLANKVIANDIPQVPFGFDKFLQIYGPGLGGVRYNQVIGTIDTGSVFVKQ
ncbi:peptide/nickel transport system substrate-binding protein [Streptacidiphilus sp. MAP12-20]|uniref:ABC transporter substrate-binding protein n=1 Tax=Streptacidiphilus sp. MAP12-20 TaxID=3156299 RepID=UPI0035161CA0